MNILNPFPQSGPSSTTQARQAPMVVRGYIGRLGSGKTYSMMRDAVAWLRTYKGQIYTNMADVSCPEAIYIDNIQQILMLRDGLLLLDEASAVLSARFWQSVPRPVLTRFAQLRKHGIALYYTAQHEDRVDTVLRELTNEYIVLHKFGGGYFRRVHLPGQTKPTSGRWLQWDQQIFALYDTYEVIASEGGSAGRASAARALSRVAAKTKSADDRDAARKQVRSLIEMIYWHGKTPVYTKEASLAREYLQDNGWWDKQAAASQQVQRELQRRRWLRVWGLGPDDAPHTCTPANPWLEGFSPSEVQARTKQEDMEQKARDLIEYAREGRPKGNNGSRKAETR